MAARPRPRPQPRIVSRQPASAGGDAQSNTVGDEDDLFRRNRGRTAQHWKQLRQSDKAIPCTRSDDDWNSFDNREGSFSRPRKKKPIKQNEPPRWQSADPARLLSSDNENDDVQIVDQASKKTENVSPNKRKRERSRSRSIRITPPPELPAHQHENAMYLVRKALDLQPRAPSPNFFMEDSTDTIELHPELAKIADEVRQKAHIDPKYSGGPETVNIKVHWRPHPLNTSAEEQHWTFKLGRNDTFRELFDEVADLAGVMTAQLVINHDHRPVFASATPYSLHIWAEGELEACDKQTAEYLRAQRTNRAASPLQDDTPENSGPMASSDDESEAESTGGDIIKLVLRSTATKDKTFPLTVRSTTTCSAVVKAFLKAAGLSDNYARGASSGKRGKGAAPYPQLMVDGDRMDSEAEIGDADLEDGDLIEVVGV